MDDLALLSLNDEGEVITEIKKPTPWKKISLIVGSFALILITLIVIIIISFTSQSEESNKKDDDQTPPSDDKYYVGQILCTYDVHSAQVETQILSDEFIKKTNFDIYIDDKRQDFAKKIKFPKFGDIVVTYSLKENINMENMFIDV